jgi:hypothetical protein
MRHTRLHFLTTRPFQLKALCLATATFMAACGGSGGGSATTTGITLSGTAATGEPMAGAPVVVRDSTGTDVCENACTVGTDGAFAVNLKSSARGPFVLLITQDGSDEPQVSMVDTTRSTTVNVSPITTLIAARLAPSGDPSKLTAADLSATQIDTATTEVKTALQPLLAAAGVPSDANPLTMSFKADSTGLDKALDLLGKPVIVRNTSTGKTSIEVELKASGSDGAADTDTAVAKITLSTGGAITATGLNADKLKASLPADGLSIQIADFLKRASDCYGTAPDARRPAGATLASQITADTCKGLFVDSDPSKYLHNNYVVSAGGATLPAGSGSRFSGAFKGIFSTVQGMKFDLPEYRYTIKNGNTKDSSVPMDGDVVFTARWTVTDPNAANVGQSDVSEYLVRAQDGKLRLLGNQSKHDLTVRAQARREEMPAVADYAYLSTGYNIGISERRWDHDNNTSTAKVSIYEQVVVTSPRGKTFTFKPIPGNNYDYLGLVRSSGSISGSATVRLTGAYLNAATAGHPNQRFTNEFWGSETEWTDEAIQAIPAQGNWKFDITLTDAFVTANASSGTQKHFTQYRRTINRAPTLAELQSVQWPELKDPLKTVFSTQSSNQGYVAISTNNLAAALELDGWSVADKAWTPTHVKVYGSSWDEGSDVASTARKVTLRCTGTGAHCEKSAGTNTGKFLNAGYGYLQMTGYNSKRLNMSLNYSSRKTTQD